MPATRAGLVLAVLILSSACAGNRSFVCPTRGGSPWHEAASEHFLVRTDAGEGKASEMVVELETLRSALLAAIFGGEVATPGQMEVVVFRNLDELLPFTRDVRVGGLMAEDALGERTLLLAEDGGPQARRLVAHELAHALSFHRIPRQPHWFAEGLASFLEGAGEQGRGSRSVGSPPGDDMAFIEVAVKPPARDVLEWRLGSWPLEHLYGKSLLIMHYLYNERRAGLRDLETRLAAMENPRAAWNAAFPEWNLEDGEAMSKLDAAIASHAGRYLRRTTIAAPAAKVTPAVRRLSPPEVHALRLGLPHRWIPEVVRAEVEEALAEDPGNVRALEAKARERRDLAVTLARQATAAHPDDPRAWELLGDVLEGAAGAKEREAAFRRAAAASPNRARPLVMLAFELGEQGRYPDALAESLRALELAPWSPAALLVQGQALAHLGRCDEARVAAGRAADVASHGSGVPAPVVEGVRLIERRCSRGPAAGRAGGR